jgi:hypothetical protein
MKNTNGVVTAGNQRIHQFMIPGDSGMQVLAYGSEEGFQVEMSADGKVLLPKTRFSGFSFEPGLAAYTADLNGDGKRDFAVYSYSGGCGLASGYCDIAFLLSNRDGYALVTVSTLWPDPGNYVVLGGKPCFIHTGFSGVETCKDGKEHHFWIYNILVFDGSNMRIDNGPVSGFPRTVYYSFKPNHQETTLITDKQKAGIIRQAQEEIFRP